MKTFVAARALSAAIVAASLFTVPAVAQTVEAPSGAYALDKTHASITWRVKHLGMSNYTARFTDFDIDLTLDVDAPANSTVSATIDPKSVRTDFPGEKDFDGEIANDARFLNADQHAEITFTSTAIEVTGDNTAKITGDLSMAGATQEVVLDATLNGSMAEHPFAKKPAVGFSATGELDRTAFGIEFLAPFVVAPTVEFMIEAEFVKAD